MNAPDKDVLLQKIESKKALGGQFVQSETVNKPTRKKRAVWVSFACSLIILILVVAVVSVSVFGPSAEDGANVGANIIDYRSEWQFDLDRKISFDAIDKTMKEAGVNLIYEYNPEWSIVKTQITQDESMYREYYVKDDVTMEVTVLLEEKIMSVESKYRDILRNIYDSSVHGQYRVYDSEYTVGGSRLHAYVIYLKDQVYIFVRQ